MQEMHESVQLHSRYPASIAKMYTHVYSMYTHVYSMYTHVYPYILMYTLLYVNIYTMMHIPILT